MLNRRDFLKDCTGKGITLTCGFLSAKVIYPLVDKHGVEKPVDGKIQESAINTANNPSRGKYTFDNFVVGSSNKFAYLASLEICNKPGNNRYNPLFIQSAAGLGKTHLLMAIKNQLLSRNFTKVVYIDSGSYFCEFINCLKAERLEDFRSKYRGADVLLLDNVSHLAEKVHTQYELLYTYDSLYESGKQIVFSGHQYPSETHGLNDRLISRLASALIVDIQPPDIETRMKILKTWAERESVPMPDDTIFYIASNVKTDIRKLEGVFRRVAALNSLYGEKINISNTRKVLKNIV